MKRGRADPLHVDYMVRGRRAGVIRYSTVASGIGPVRIMQSVPSSIGMELRLIEGHDRSESNGRSWHSHACQNGCLITVKAPLAMANARL